MAFGYLAIPCISCECERAFSSAKKTMTFDRMSLKEDTVKECEFTTQLVAVRHHLSLLLPHHLHRQRRRDGRPFTRRGRQKRRRLSVMTVRTWDRIARYLPEVLCTRRFP